MPKLNSTHLLAGVAGVPASLDLVTIPILGVIGDWCFLTDTLQIGQVELVPNQPQIQDSTGRVIEGVGAFFLAASGTGAYRTERTVANERPIAGAEGYIAVIADYANGIGIKVYRDDGSIVWQDVGAPIGGPPSRNCAIRNGILSAWLHGRFELTELATGASMAFLSRPDVDWLVPARGDAGETCLLERSDTHGLTFRAANAWQALQLLPPSQQIFNPDLIRRDGVFTYTWSLTTGEEIPNVRSAVVDRSIPYPVVDTNPNPGEGPVDPPIDPPPATVTIISSKVAGRAMFYADGDMRLTVRVPKGQLPTPKAGDVIKIVTP